MALAVGILHYTAPPVVGGVEAVIGEHARLMTAAGHRVRVLAGRGRPIGPGIELVRLPLADTRHPEVLALRAELAGGRVTGRLASIRDELVVGLRRASEGLDVLIAHNVCSLPVNLALTAALDAVLAEGAVRRLVAWNHDLAWTSPRYAVELHPGAPWELLARSWPGAVPVVVSGARRDEYARLTGLPLSDIRVVPNGIDRLRFLSIHPRTRATLTALDLPDDAPVLLAPVRITPRKNLDLAVRVLAALRRDGDDARLVVTGPRDPHDPASAAHVGELHALAERLGVAGAVHLLSAETPAGLSDRVIADLYRVADALLLPSRDEGFGLPILEAAACRLPVFCADLPPLREIAGNDATYFDPDGDPATIAAMVRDGLAAERTDRLALRVRSGFGWRAIYDERIEPLLQEAAS